MSEDTCIYKVVPNIDKYYFKCVESQFIGLAYSYYGEFWKLFIGQNIDIDFDDKKTQRKYSQLMNILRIMQKNIMV